MLNLKFSFARLGKTMVVAVLGSLLSVSAWGAGSIAYRGITWTFSTDRTTGTFVNGEPWVIGPVTITNISPNPTQSTNGVQNGSMINPIPAKNQGLDSHPYITSDIVYEAAKNVALSFPFNVQAGDVLVSSIGQNTYPTYLKTVCALTVLNSAPPSGSFRPSIFGTDHTVKYNVSQMNWSVLKNYAAVSSTPSKAEITAMVPPLPWFEWAGIWSGNSMQPTDNTADGDKQYGRETAAKFGHVGLWLNTNQPLADKQPIAIQMVQNGIDIYNYVKFGGGFYHDGGHKCGRKLPLVVAAMMLNDSDLKTMAANPDIFQEDTQTFYVTQSDIGRVVNLDYPGYVTAPYIQSDVGVAEWGIRHRWEPFYDNRTWNTGYRHVVSPGMMGPWLAAYLMGAQTVWNHPAAFGFMERYHALSGDGGITVSQQNFNRQMYAAYKSGTVTPSVQYTANPIITPASGYFDTTQTVTITCSTPSSTIRYTVNGATPGASDPVYSGPFSVSTTKTVKAIAYATGMEASSVITAQLSFGASPPSFSPAPGGFSDPQTVTLTSATSGASVRYTIDGSDPTANSPLYTGPIAVATTTTIKAISVKSGIENSPVSTGVYAIGAFLGSQEWTTVAFDPKAVAFTYGFDMIASGDNIDAVVGLAGTNPVSAYTQLACSIRFNTEGKIDARNGGAYAAVTDLPYTAGSVYSVRLTVNPATKTYSASVSTNGGNSIIIAQNYAFRTEQSTMATFTSMAINAMNGSQTVSNYGFIPDRRPSAPQGLRVVNP
ncbi:MAG: chitobiase/beta-hexosaminidase C-terminal domain-containing protein [Luteolibacter sp.]